MMVNGVEPWKIPERYLRSGGGHLLMAKIWLNFKQATDMSILQLRNEKSKYEKLKGLSDGHSVQLRSKLSGIASTKVCENDVRYFLLQMSQTNYCWDVGCQMAYYKKRFCIQNPYTMTCFCPCGKHMEFWRMKSEIIVDMFRWRTIPICDDKLDTPHDLWKHCVEKGRDCILHYSLQKYLEKTYEDIVTKVSGNNIVKNSIFTI